MKLFTSFSQFNGWPKSDWLKFGPGQYSNHNDIVHLRFRKGDPMKDWWWIVLNFWTLIASDFTLIELGPLDWSLVEWSDQSYGGDKPYGLWGCSFWAVQILNRWASLRSSMLSTFNLGTL